MPSPIYIDNIRVPASCLNFYITNKFVLLPIFNDAKDNLVINIFKKEFKNRKIIPIDCSDLIWGFGAIHCMTQQEPNIILNFYKIFVFDQLIITEAPRVISSSV